MTLDPIQTTIADLYAEFGVPGIKPKWALITEDCREHEGGEKFPSLSGHAALYLGDFSMPSVVAFRDPSDPAQLQRDASETARLHDAICVHPAEYPDDTEFDISMPLLLTDSGDIIWGCECYWGAVDNETVELAEKFGIRELALGFLDEAAHSFKKSHAYSALRNLIEREIKEGSSGTSSKPGEDDNS